ncbi:MAG TPA: hypothetical protein VFR81_00120 [Longimicrobium sp.]|nr:hypothetical protein [Longimicrobium sp.]
MNARPPRPDTPVVRQLRERAKVYAAYEESARDPDFMAEMLETVAAFDVALLDGLTEPPGD